MHLLSKPWIWKISLLLMTAIAPALPALAASPEDGSVVILPYVAVGGAPDGWHFQTLLMLSNQHPLSNSGAIEFFSNDGRPLPLRMNDGAALATQAAWTLPAQRSKLFILTHPGHLLQAGWLRVKPSEKSPLQVTVVIQFYNGDYLAGETGIQTAPENESTSYHAIASHRVLSLWGLPNPSTSAMTRPFPSLREQERKAPRLPLLRYAPPSSSPPRFQADQQERPVSRFVEIGTASWYGAPYHGHQAANGKIYDQEMPTAAHRTLAFGTRARIINLRNRHSVVVHITDRGPFVTGRVVDLSLAAARELGIIESGISPVRVEILPPS